MTTDEIQLQTNAQSRVWGTTSASAVTPTLTKASGSLTVTTAFRTMEIPFTSETNVALAVETAKLVVLTDLMRETPEERKERIEKEERQTEERKELEACAERLEALLAEQAVAQRSLTEIRTAADATLNALDGAAVRAVILTVSKAAEGTQARNLAEAWLKEESSEALQVSPAERLRTLVEAITEGWRYPDNEVRFEG